MKLYATSLKAATLVIVLGLLLSAIPFSFVRAQTTTLTFTATADSYVNAPYPNNNFGKNVALRVDNSPATRSYLRFNVNGLNGATITSARLRVYANFASTSKTGYEVHSLSNNTWTETGITYANAPAPGSLIKAVGSFSAKTWTEVDVTSALKGDGSLNLALTLPDSSDAVSLAARESGSTAPQLIVVASTPQPTSTPTIAPTIAPTVKPTNSPTKAPTSVPTTASSQTTTLTFKPTADSYTNAPYPDRNFGTNVALRVDDSPLTYSYLRFNVQGINGAAITSAKLRVYANTASTSGTGYEVHSLSNNTWTETGITYANQPAPGSLIKAAGAFAANAWTEVDVTSAVKGDGSLNLALTLPDSSNAVSLAARESGSNAPQLVVTVSASQPTTVPTLAPTVKPTTAPTIVPTVVPTLAPTVGPTIAPTPKTTTFIFTPTADSYTNAPYPDRNFGTNVALRVDNSPLTHSYLRFNIQGLNGAFVTSAQLWVYANTASTSGTGYEVHSLSNNTWTEAGITYANQPAPGGLIKSAGTFATNAWTQVDITSAVKGDGSLNLVLTLPDSSNAVSLAAREAGSNAPKLSVTVSSTQPTAAPTAVPTIAPTAVPTAAPSPIPTQPVPVPQGGSVWFVSPGGRSSGDGSQGNPWDLQTALNQPSSVKPGDTIWLRGGRYNPPFKAHLKGASGKPIIVRQYPGERATLDGSGPILTIDDSSWVYYWGFEITASNNARPYSTSPNPEHGILTNNSYSSSNIKFINLVIHDVPGVGLAWWRTNVDSEVYGSLIYNNGTNQLDHGIYSQNETGTKRITNNILFDNASHGIQVYTSGGAPIDNYIISGNTVFDNGASGVNTTNGTTGNYVRNIIVGGQLVANNDTVANNYTYFTTSSTSFNLGYSTGSNNAKVTNNYFMQGKVTIGGSTSGLSFTGNTIFGSPDGFSTSTYSGNTFVSSKPTGLKYFVQPNIYEPGRANLTIYNWDKASTVNLPASALSSVQIKSGDHYELHNALNFYGDVITGTYNGSSLSLPMTARSVAKAVGCSNTMPNPFPEFGVFVLIDLGQ